MFSRGSSAMSGSISGSYKWGTASGIQRVGAGDGAQRPPIHRTAPHHKERSKRQGCRTHSKELVSSVTWKMYLFCWNTGRAPGAPVLRRSDIASVVGTVLHPLWAELGTVLGPQGHILHLPTMALTSLAPGDCLPCDIQRHVPARQPHGAAPSCRKSKTNLSEHELFSPLRS